MIIQNLFSVGLGVVDLSECLPLANKIFDDNAHLFDDFDGAKSFKSTLKSQRSGKYDVNDNYVYRYDVERLKDQILSKSVDYIQQTGLYYPDRSYSVKGIWFNELKGDNFIGLHDHYGNVISGCYYVSVPEVSQPITFHNPLHGSFFPRYYNCKHKEGLNEYSRATYTYTPKAGELLLWFSMLPHEVVTARRKTNSDVRRSVGFDVSDD